jgi:hypothetical protein
MEAFAWAWPAGPAWIPFEIDPLFLKFMVNVDIGILCLDGAGGNQAPFQYLMGVMKQKIPIFKGPGFMFSGIAHKVAFLDPMMNDFFPFESGWKPGSPPAP